MTRYFIIAITCLLISCSSQKKVTTNIEDKNPGAGDTRTYTVESLDANTYLLSEIATDKTYGYTKENPVKTGGVKEQSGPLNERRYLNALLGPNGELVEYYRAGSCCSFRTPNGYVGNSGLLDRYRVWWKGSKDTMDIYINMYDKGDLFVPIGFTARK